MIKFYKNWFIKFKKLDLKYFLKNIQFCCIYRETYTHTHTHTHTYGTYIHTCCIYIHLSFPSGANSKDATYQCTDIRNGNSVPGLGRPPEGGNGCPLQYSYLAGSSPWVTKRQTWLKWLSTEHIHCSCTHMKVNSEIPTDPHSLIRSPNVPRRPEVLRLWGSGFGWDAQPGRRSSSSPLGTYFPMEVSAKWTVHAFL